MDRLGRSLRDLLGVLDSLHAAGCGLYLFKPDVDTTTPAGRALFSTMGVFAEFERAMIRDRILAGQARARAAGKHLGRPRTPGRWSGRSKPGWLAATVSGQSGGLWGLAMRRSTGSRRAAPPAELAPNAAVHETHAQFARRAGRRDPYLAPPTSGRPPARPGPR